MDLLIRLRRLKKISSKLKRIVGTITDQSGNPLPGVSILVKGTT